MNQLANELINAFVEDAEQHAMRIGTRIIVPTVYRCYLDEEDYKNISDIYPQIRDETKKALDNMVYRINRMTNLRQFVFRLLIPKWVTIFSQRADELRNLPQLEKPIQGWQIVNPTFSPEVKRPMIKTAVEMTFSQQQEGGDTVRYTTERKGGKILNSSSDTITNKRQSQGSSIKSNEKVYATIVYQSAQGEHSYTITSEEVTIGRAHNADLELSADTRISRKHCVLRRDNQTKLFTIEDLSMEGTSVNGNRLEKGQKVSMPSQATIDLAGVISLEFRINS
jgi:hypothetical protein